MPDKRQRNQAAKRAQKGAPAKRAVSKAATADSPTGCGGWLWWRAARDPQSRSRAKEDYHDARKVPIQVRAEFDKMRQRYMTGGLRNGANIKYIGDGIYEFKYSHIGNTPYRLLFMRWGQWAVALDVFKKTTDDTPKARAMERRAGWLRLFGAEPPE
jgi:phage-related protein